jgi:hypothetical protein
VGSPLFPRKNTRCVAADSPVLSKVALEGASREVTFLLLVFCHALSMSSVAACPMLGVPKTFLFETMEILK